MNSITRENVLLLQSKNRVMVLSHHFLEMHLLDTEEVMVLEWVNQVNFVKKCSQASLYLL